jgi:hypothetical protein
MTTLKVVVISLSSSTINIFLQNRCCSLEKSTILIVWPHFIHRPSGSTKPLWIQLPLRRNSRLCSPHFLTGIGRYGTSSSRVPIDAHKMKCTTVMFDGDSVTGSFDFQTTRQGVYEFMKKVPEGSIAVIESSTTGKVLSRMLSGRYEVHMVAPPERRVSIKTDRRDAERIVMEDMLNYLRRCYIPSQYIENIRFVVTQQIQIERRIARVTRFIHYWR